MATSPIQIVAWTRATRHVRSPGLTDHRSIGAAIENEIKMMGDNGASFLHAGFGSSDRGPITFTHPGSGVLGRPTTWGVLRSPNRPFDHWLVYTKSLLDANGFRCPAIAERCFLMRRR